MKAKIKEVKDIPLGDLVIGKGQVRTKDVAKDIDELAQSISVMGLLEPIVVCQAEKAGKYEILTGQRRFLAHKQLKMQSIMAVVLEKRVDEGVAKAISITENLIRRDLSPKELIDACTALFNKYGSIKDVSDATGISPSLVSKYVKFDRLLPKLKKMVTDGVVDIKTAMRAQDAASVTGTPDEKEAVKLVKEMSTMSGVQQRKLVQEISTNPDTSVDEVIESAKTGGKITQILVSLTAGVHKSLQAYADQEETNQDDAAATLIEEGLKNRGVTSALERILSPEERKNLLLSVGTHRGGRPLSPIEVGVLFKKAMDGGASLKDCAEAARLEGTTLVSRFLRLVEITPEVRHLVSWGKTEGPSLGFTVATEIARLHEAADQVAVATAALKQKLSSAEARQVAQLRLRSHRPIEDCISGALKMRPEVEVRHVFIGAIKYDNVRSQLRTITQAERDRLLNELLQRSFAHLRVTGRLAIERFTLVGGPSFAPHVKDEGLEEAINRGLQGKA